MAFQTRDFKSRLFRQGSGITRLAVTKGPVTYHFRNGTGYSAVGIYLRDKLHREVTVTSAKDAAARMTTVITVDGASVEKRVTTQYGGKATREDVFAANSNGLTRRTEWTYLHGVKATATYEAGKRRLEISGPKQATSVFETSGKPIQGGWESVTASLSGPRSAVLGNNSISPGSTVSIVVPLYDKNYTTKRDDGTTELGSSRTGTTNSVTNPGSIPGATKTDATYDVYDHFGEPGAKKVGEGSSSLEYDPSTGRSHGETFEVSPDGTRTSSSIDTDGQGGITTHTRVTETDADGQTKTYESTETTNPDGSGSRTTTTTDSHGTKTVETVTTDSNGESRTETETYDKDGKKTSENDTSEDHPTDHPDNAGSGSAYPNSDGPDDPPNPAWMGPADVVYSGYLDNVNAYLGGNSLSQGAFTDLGDPPPFDAISAATVSEAGGQGGQVLTSSVAVFQSDDPDLNPRALVGAMGRLSVLPTQSAAFLAVTKVASVLGPVMV